MKKTLKFIVLAVLFAVIFTTFIACSRESKIDRLLESAAKSESTAKKYLQEGKLESAVRHSNKAEDLKNQAEALKEYLSSPENFRIEGNTLKWDEVEHASGYLINFTVLHDSASKVVYENFFELPFDMSQGLPYKISLTARGGRYYKDSSQAHIEFEGTNANTITYKDYLGNGKDRVETWYPVAEEMKISFYTLGYEKEINGVKKFFSGLYYDSDYTKPCMHEEKIDSSTTVYAKWVNSIDEVSGVDFIVDSDGKTRISKAINLRGVYVIPENTHMILKGAFSGNKELAYVILSDNVISVGEKAFEKCSGLLGVMIGKNVSSLADNAFEECDKLIEVVNHSSLKDIGEFNEFTELHSEEESKMMIAENFLFYLRRQGLFLVGYIGNDKNISLPEFQEIQYNIMQNAFRGNPYIESVTIPDGVYEIGVEAFSSCKNLSEVKIGNDVVKISGKAFYGCEKLANITLGNSVQKIEYYAFNSGIYTSIVIPVSVSEIGRYAFASQTLEQVAFLNPIGWHVENSMHIEIKVNSSDLLDKTISATYLRTTYVDEKWVRKP